MVFEETVRNPTRLQVLVSHPPATAWCETRARRPRYREAPIQEGLLLRTGSRRWCRWMEAVEANPSPQRHRPLLSSTSAVEWPIRCSPVSESRLDGALAGARLR